VGTVLVDGRVAAGWSLRDGVVVVDPFRPLSSSERDSIEEERAGLQAFHA
jgi:hypothetical protein